MAEQQQQRKFSCGGCANLDRQRRTGWRMFYQMEEQYYQTVSRRNEEYQELKQELESRNVWVELPMHIRDEMVSSLKELDCPVCLQQMTRETFNLTPCFHKVCKTCTQEIRAGDSKCPICRRKI